MFIWRTLSLFLAGLALLAVGLACGLSYAQPMSLEMTAVSEEPAAEQASPLYVETIPTLGEPLATPTSIPAFFLAFEPTLVSPPAIPETRRLTLEYPPIVRVGDATRIRLQLEVDERGFLTPTAVVPGNVVVGETVEIPNLYDTHLVLVETRLDLAGMEINPPGTIIESLQPGLPVTFYWSVKPDSVGNYQGAVWLHLRFIPRAGGEESRIPVSVQFIDMEVRSFLGLSGGAARGLGAIGSALSAVLGFPFADDALKWLWRRRRKTI